MTPGDSHKSDIHRFLLTDPEMFTTEREFSQKSNLLLANDVFIKLFTDTLRKKGIQNGSTCL